MNHQDLQIRAQALKELSQEKVKNKKRHEPSNYKITKLKSLFSRKKNGNESSRLKPVEFTVYPV